MARRKAEGQASPSATTPPPAMGRLQKIAIVAGVIAAINEAGLRNVMAAAMLTAVGPLAATGFIYQVSAMRSATLAYEAADRVHYAARLEAGIDEPVKTPKPVPATREDHPDMARKLDAMIASRTALLDTFGDDPSTVAPVYIRVIKQMLRDDDETLASIGDNGGGTIDDAAVLAAKEARLREIHERLTHLAGV